MAIVSIKKINIHANNVPSTRYIFTKIFKIYLFSIKLYTVFTLVYLNETETATYKNIIGFTSHYLYAVSEIDMWKNNSCGFHEFSLSTKYYIKFLHLLLYKFTLKLTL
jgi:hypothetical protein